MARTGLVTLTQMKYYTLEWRNCDLFVTLLILNTELNLSYKNRNNIDREERKKKQQQQNVKT